MAGITRTVAIMAAALRNVLTSRPSGEDCRAATAPRRTGKRTSAERIAVTWPPSCSEEGGEGAAGRSLLPETEAETENTLLLLLLPFPLLHPIPTARRC